MRFFGVAGGGGVRECCLLEECCVFGALLHLIILLTTIFKDHETPRQPEHVKQTSNEQRFPQKPQHPHSSDSPSNDFDSTYSHP